MFLQFEHENERKYFTDLESFLREAKFEDFYNCGKGEICVATIHKSKGREFDNVYMLVSPFQQMSEQQLRSIYVGMTRSKTNLYIFHKVACFDNIKKGAYATQVKWGNDMNEYPEPEEIELPLTLRDMWLEFAMEEKIESFIEKVQSGDELYVAEVKNGDKDTVIFQAKIQGKWRKVACTSKSFYKEYRKHKEKGYDLCGAKVQFVVRWKNKDSGKEFDIVLPVLTMKKSSNNQ